MLHGGFASFKPVKFKKEENENPLIFDLHFFKSIYGKYEPVERVEVFACTWDTPPKDTIAIKFCLADFKKREYYQFFRVVKDDGEIDSVAMEKFLWYLKSTKTIDYILTKYNYDEFAAEKILNKMLTAIDDNIAYHSHALMLRHKHVNEASVKVLQSFQKLTGKEVLDLNVREQKYGKSCFYCERKLNLSDTVHVCLLDKDLVCRVGESNACERFKPVDNPFVPMDRVREDDIEAKL